MATVQRGCGDPVSVNRHLLCSSYVELEVCIEVAIGPPVCLKNVLSLDTTSVYIRTYVHTYTICVVDKMFSGDGYSDAK